MRKAKRQTQGIALLLVAFAVAILAWAGLAKATEKPATTSQSQNMTQDQSQHQSQTSSSVSGGGQASSNLYDGTTTRTIAVGTTSPTPLHDTPSCYLPAKGIKRVRQALFGVVTLDSRLVRDDGCMADVQSEREYQLARLQAETQLEQARTERLRAEHQASCSAAAEGLRAACEAK